MGARPNVKDVALFCEWRTGERAGVSTVVFPNGSRAKFDANLVILAGVLIDCALPDEWGQCDLCDRFVPYETLQAYEEGSACERCCHG